MNVLAFDTCLNACSVAVGVGIGTAGERVVGRCETMEQGQAERLIPMIGAALRDADLRLADVDHMAVTVGPGSFTGTRICVAAARALQLAQTVPVTTLSSLALIARQSALSGQSVTTPWADDLVTMRSDRICAAVNMRGGAFYAQLFAGDGMTSLSQPMLLNDVQLRDLCGGTPTRVVGIGDLSVVKNNAFNPQLGTNLATLRPNARDAMAFVSRNSVQTYALTPLYLRPPDATPSAAPLLKRRT